MGLPVVSGADGGAAQHGFGRRRGRAQRARLALPIVIGLMAMPWAGPAGLLGAAGIVVGLRRRAAAVEARRWAARRGAVVELAVALSGELRGGQSPTAAFAHSAHALDDGDGLHAVLAPAVVAAAMGGDISTLLKSAANTTPGAEGLRRLAACWQVSAPRGAGLAAAVERVADGLRHDEGVRREVTAQLAAPRATARLLAALPVFGVVLGTWLGADPLLVLLGTPWGWCLLGMAGFLVVTGVLWTDRLAASVERLM
jgi:tight adherence protein B